MKNNGKCFLWALCVTVLGLGANGTEGAAAPGTAESVEAAGIKAGLGKIGVGEGYTIVVGDQRDRVETTAAEMMQRFLAKAAVSASIVTESEAPAGKRILVGRESSLKAIKELGDKGEIKIRDVSAEDDGFCLKKIGDDIAVAGANPRGVLYGVYAFEDFVNAGATGNLDVKKVPYFRERGSGLNYTDVGFSAELEEFPEEKAVCLSRLGINQMTDQGFAAHLSKFVHSDVFPFQAPPKADFQRKVKEMSAICAKYGIDFYVLAIEPGLDEIAGSYDSYPKEALGKVRPPWGGGKDGLAPTLCVNSPVAQEHLRNMMKKLVREYPDVKGAQLYNLDVNTWLCTPELCERCRKVCEESSQRVFNPWELQAKLVTLLSNAAHEERPGFDVRFWSTVHFHGEMFDKMIHAANGFSSMMSSWTGSDRSVMVPDAAQRSATCILSQEIAEERSIPFHMISEFNNLEVIPRSLSFPFHVSDALKKYKQWNVRCLTEIYGPELAHNSVNALATKEFEWNPDQNPEAFLADLSRRQFGDSAGKLAYRSWEQVGKAFDVWNDVQGPPFPLVGSQFHSKIGTAIGGLPPAITPEGAKTYGSLIDILTSVEPWLAEAYSTHKTKPFLEKMEQMSRYLAEAANLAKEAIAEASDQAFIGVCVYEGADGRPTCKAYAEINYAPIAVGDCLCKQRCNLIRAFLLQGEIEQAKTSGDAKLTRDKEAAYRKLLQDDLALQESFLDLLTRFSGMKPCLTRTSFTEEEIRSFIAVQKTKIEKTKAFLAG